MPIAGGQCAFINFFLVGACAARSSAPAQRGWSKRSEVGGCAARLEDAQRGRSRRSEFGACAARFDCKQQIRSMRSEVRHIRSMRSEVYEKDDP